ncbi:hypothetical protein CTI14_39965, partial [Methylobacterium radiotolerans]
FGLLALLGSTASWAVANCTQTISAVSVNTPPHTHDTPGDAAIGTALTDWLTTSHYRLVHLQRLRKQWHGDGTAHPYSQASGLLCEKTAPTRIAKN